MPQEHEQSDVRLVGRTYAWERSESLSCYPDHIEKQPQILISQGLVAVSFFCFWKNELSKSIRNYQKMSKFCGNKLHVLLLVELIHYFEDGFALILGEMSVKFCGNRNVIMTHKVLCNIERDACSL